MSKKEQDKNTAARTPAAELGAELRRQRKQRGLAVGEVSERLKLPTRQVEALESGHYEDLPEPVFVRGFLRSYGRFLELDETLLNSLLEQISPVPKVSNTAEANRGADLNFADEKIKKPFPSWIFGLLAVAALGTGVYFWQTKSQTENARKTAEEASTPIAAGSKTAASQPVPNLNGGNTLVVDMPASDAQTASAAVASNPAAAIMAAGELVINTRYRTMLTVSNAKGEILINQIVPANSEHRFKDGAPYEVRLGYAIGATATFGGEAVDIDGKRKGKTAVFTVGSAVQAASAPQ